MSEEEKSAWVAEQKALEKARLDKEMFIYKYGEDKGQPNALIEICLTMHRMFRMGQCHYQGSICIKATKGSQGQSPPVESNCND